MHSLPSGNDGRGEHLDEPPPLLVSSGESRAGGWARLVGWLRCPDGRRCSDWRCDSAPDSGSASRGYLSHATSSSWEAPASGLGMPAKTSLAGEHAGAASLCRCACSTQELGTVLSLVIVTYETGRKRQRPPGAIPSLSASEASPQGRRPCWRNSRISSAVKPKSTPSTFDCESPEATGRIRETCPSLRLTLTSPSCTALSSTDAKFCPASEFVYTTITAPRL
jgi:hypothetical protein